MCKTYTIIITVDLLQRQGGSSDNGLVDHLGRTGQELERRVRELVSLRGPAASPTLP